MAAATSTSPWTWSSRTSACSTPSAASTACRSSCRRSCSVYFTTAHAVLALASSRRTSSGVWRKPAACGCWARASRRRWSMTSRRCRGTKSACAAARSADHAGPGADRDTLHRLRATCRAARQGLAPVAGVVFGRCPSRHARRRRDRHHPRRQFHLDGDRSHPGLPYWHVLHGVPLDPGSAARPARSEEHTSELQSRRDLVCRLLLEKKKQYIKKLTPPKETIVSNWLG